MENKPDIKAWEAMIAARTARMVNSHRLACPAM
jgi:hypothetical protein